MTFKNYRKQQERKRQQMMNELTSQVIFGKVIDKYKTWKKPTFTSEGMKYEQTNNSNSKAEMY